MLPMKKTRMELEKELIIANKELALQVKERG